MSTPRFVIEAVTQYMEGKPEPLIEMFKNGAPLNEYPESSEIIINGILGKSSKRAGRQPLTRNQKAIYYRVLMRVAELVGAGLPVINNGESNKESACEIVAKEFRFKKVETVYKQIWLKDKDADEVKEQIARGKHNKTALLELINK